MLWAYRLGKQIFSDYSSKFSRQDFTHPQLFACLVLREHRRRVIVASKRSCAIVRSGAPPSA